MAYKVQTGQYVQRYRYKYQYMYVRVYMCRTRTAVYPEYQNQYIRVYERRICILVPYELLLKHRLIQYYSSTLTVRDSA